MSGTQVSSFGNASQNALFDPLMARRQTQYDTNDLLSKQAIGAGDTEMVARLAQSLVNMPEEEAAKAYGPGIAYLQQQGFAKHAPTVYPGHAVAQRLAALAVPAVEQYKLGQAAAAGRGVTGAYGFGGGAAGGAPGTATGGAAPAGGGGGSVAAGEIEPPARERALAVRDGLVKRGMDVETATGFAANALHESAANPNTGAGDRGASHGLFQWTADRYNAYIAKNGHPPDNAPLDEQLDFVMHELNGSESLAKGRIAQAQGVDGKAAEISAAFLRPKDTEAEMKRRAATALKLAGGWSQPVTAPQSDQAWLDNQAKTYPAMAGPNVNMQAGTQPPGAPTGGVAARTGGTDVAGPGAGSGGAPGAAAAPMRETYVRGADGTVQKALVPTDGSGPPVPVPPAASVASTASTQQPPAPTAPAPAQMPAELQTNEHNLTKRDRAELAPLADMVNSGRLPAVTFQNEVQQRQAANDARKDKWQAQERQKVEDTYKVAQEERAKAEELRKIAKAKDEAAVASLPFHGNAADVQNRNILIEGTKSGKVDTVEYASAYADYATEKKDAEGRVFKPDMTAYETPTHAAYGGGKGGREYGKADVSQAAIAPDKMNTAMLGNLATLRNIDNALKELNAHPDSVGVTGLQPDWMSQRTDPEGIQLRADIADILSGTFHERSGGAVTVSEAPRMQPFTPSQKDTAVALRTKLERMRSIVTGVLTDHYEVYGPKGGFRASPGIEAALKAAPTKSTVLRYDASGKVISE